VDREKVFHDVTDLEAVANELVIEFTLDGLFGELGGLMDVEPELQDQLKSLVREAMGTLMGDEPDGPAEDAEEIFRDLLEPRDPPPGS
jgi:hypothetical protein